LTDERLGPIRILWVDPSAKDIARCVSSLKKQGFQIDHVCSGAHALQLAQRATYDVAIIELMLPDALGTDVWHSLCQRHHKMSVVLTTSAPSLHRSIKPDNTRLIAFVLKPVRSRPLARMVIPQVPAYACLQRAHKFGAIASE